MPRVFWLDLREIYPVNITMEPPSYDHLVITATLFLPKQKSQSVNFALILKNLFNTVGFLWSLIGVLIAGILTLSHAPFYSRSHSLSTDHCPVLRLLGSYSHEAFWGQVAKERGRE